MKILIPLMLFGLFACSEGVDEKEKVISDEARENNLATFPAPICEIVSHFDTTGSKFPYINALKTEIVLDLDSVAIEPDSANNLIAETHRYIRVVNENDSISNLIVQSIPKDSLFILFKEAVAIAQDGDTYVTGLSLHFGLEVINSKNILRLFFQPISAIKNDDNVYQIRKGKLYHYDNGFKVSEPVRSNQFIIDYHEKLLVDRNGDSSFPKHGSQDTKSMIFPFQTMFTLMYDNSDGNPADDLVYFNSAIRHTNQSGQENLKHCLLLSTIEYPFNRAGLLRDHYANRSHLCPTSCDFISDFKFPSSQPAPCPNQK